MFVIVKAKPDSIKEEIKKAGDNSFEIFVKEPPLQGMANRAIARVLAEYYKVPVSQVRLAKGFKQRNKIFEITN